MANPQKQFNQALQLHQAGHIAEAIDLYTKAMPRLKNNTQLPFLLGTAHLQAGNHGDCIELMKRAIQLEPNNPFAHINQGNALQALGRLEEAVAAYDRALTLKPDQVEVHNNRGAALLGLGRTDQALASFDKALALNPDYAEAHNNRGNAMHALGRTEAALASFDKALALNPVYAKAHGNRGAVLLDLGLAAEALGLFDQALLLDAQDAEAHFNRGNALKELDRAEDAVAAFDRALALGPDYAAAHNNRGAALLHLGRAEDALAAFERMLALEPDDAEAHNNHGGTLLKLGRVEEAMMAYDRALALNPDYAEAQQNKAVALMLTGRYLEGWALYEWRLKLDEDDYYRFPQPAWRGEGDIRGKRILIHAEQGLGDVMQFCRYLPMLRELGAEIIFETPKTLLPLIATLDCPMTIVAKGEALPAFDTYCPLMSLPHAFKTTLETIPADIPYLHADEGKLRAWRQRLGETDRPRVGLVWSASASYKNPHRSMRLEDLSPLLELPVEWHCLQKEYRDHDLETLENHPELRQHHEALHDFSDTAALIACMDLVITVDTSVAHCAGAMGKPVWVVLPFAPDYRWLLDRTDSPWYPTARLFRQPGIGDWPGVVAEVAAAMRRLETPD